MDFVRQFVQIWGTSWMHHKIVPIVPRTVAATGMEDWGAMLRRVLAGGGEEAAVALGCMMGGERRGYKFRVYARELWDTTVPDRRGIRPWRLFWQ